MIQPVFYLLKRSAYMPGILWSSNVDDALMKAQKEKKALFIDFYVPG
ncbi:hypothetical protein L0156_02185 [bacterium]|nr:hypothetical protein [bacterium]